MAERKALLFGAILGLDTAGRRRVTGNLECTPAGN
jgi:hypothetical protein